MNYHQIFRNLPAAIAYHRIVTDDDGTPVDYIFLEVNAAYEAITGLKRSCIIGRNVTEVMPGIRKDHFDWIGTYGKVALEGESLSFEYYSEPLNRWYKVHAYSDKTGYFTTLLIDITVDRQKIEIMRNMIELSEKLIGSNLSAFDFQTTVENLLRLSGAKFTAINTYEIDRTKTVTRAIAGIPSVIEQISSLLGFEITGQTWDILPERLSKIDGGKLVRYNNLCEASLGTISENTSNMLQKITGTGNIYVLELSFGGQEAIGDIIFFMPQEKEIQNHKEIELYAGQIGSLLARLKAEEALSVNNNTLNTVLENSLFGVAIIGKDRKIRWVNPVVCKLAGIADLDQIIGHHCRDYLCPAEQHECPIIDKGQKIDNSERVLRLSDGRIIPILKSVKEINLEGEEVLLETFIDLSDLKKAEELIDNQKERLANIVQGANIGTWELNLQTGEAVFNERWAEIIGCSLEDLGPVSIETLARYIHPDDLATSNRLLEELFKGKRETYIIECRMKHMNGYWVWINDRGKVISRTDDGKPLWVFGTRLEITDRKNAEIALAERAALEKNVSSISARFITLPSEELDKGINYALKKTGELFAADRSYLYLYSEDGLYESNTNEWCAWGIEPQLGLNQNQPVAAMPWWAETMNSSGYVHIPDVKELPPEAAVEKESLLQQNIQSLLCVPLLSEMGPIGFFGFDAVREKKAWAPEVITFMKIIAGIMVGAIEKNIAGQKIFDYTMEMELAEIKLDELYRRLDEEIDKARQLHELTLPKSLPAVSGISFAASYRPAQKLGGDYYNVLHRHNKLIIYLADVSGHGLDGAMLNIFIKEALNSYVALKPDELQPAPMLHYLHARYTEEEYPYDYFVCIYLAVLDLDKMEFAYASAGFQSLPMVAREGVLEVLHSEGPPISAVFPPELAVFAENRHTIAPGSALLFSTDGLMEQTDHSGKQYADTGRLEAVFLKNSQLPPELIVKRINADFEDFISRSETIEDDITFLILKLNPDPIQTLQLTLVEDLHFADTLSLKLAPLLTGIEDSELFLACVIELVENAIEHGNRCDPHKTTDLIVTRTEKYLQVVVEDQGEGFNWEEVTVRPLSLEGLKDRGRGIPMTKLYCEELSYNKKGNRATLIKELSQIKKDKD